MAARRSKGSEKGSGSKRGGGGEGQAPAPLPPEDIALHELTRARYLNYALSVITSRALPDVRDGLKPVQRRILYMMWQTHLTAEAKHKKCAKVVGDVMGNYHPHGDASIYDALVRMAQDFTLRVPLVDGSGNFGSLDGDPPAAYRYTECRLAPIAAALLGDIGMDTVPFRPNYDGTREEPVVLPAKLPNLLVNGSSGIAVGMATSIPPHNADEVCQAAIRLLDALQEGKELSSRELCRTIKGPDFPTGGRIVSSAEEIRAAYDTGQGTLKVRGTWQSGPTDRNKKTVIIDSIPHGINKSALVERLAEVALSRAMPLLVDVKDVSATDVRIELELKKTADEQKVMAYLCKHTPLQSNVSLNLTCLVPTENPDVGRPERLDLHSILWHFLHFRHETVSRRLQYELNALNARIHILEGFALVFDALDEILKIVRASEGKADAAQKIMKRFKLDAEQTDAILELRIYRLAKLEILVIQEELAAKRKEAKKIKGLLAEASGAGIWAIVRGELAELKGTGGPRRTEIKSLGEEAEFSEEDLIVAEDAHVLVTRDGWIKRQKEIKDPAQTRLREGDAVLAVVAGSTRATVVFLSNFGTAYTARIIDIPATTGYGEPIQKLFKLKDGESVVAAFSLDARVTGDLTEKEGTFPETYAVAASSDGYALAFGLSTFLEPSQRGGRRFARLAEGSKIVSAYEVHGDETLIAATQQCRALLCAVSEVNYLSGPGRGVILIKLGDDDALVGFKAVRDDKDTLVCKTSQGGEQRINTAKYQLSERGGKGREVIKRGSFVSVVFDVPPAPEPFEGADAAPAN
ncbi:MAG TPA: DNA topoisomerase IV subunit A [Polyangiaceae bacterium]|nr:DNA topoisomerase IV subunit A [Polyangiaceae bacterium]